MSAAQPKPTEPSMEEILASIRRIISDDQAKAPADPVASESLRAAVPAPKPVTIEQDDDDILDLQPKADKPPRQKEPHLITDDPVDNDLNFQEPVAVMPVVEQPPKGQDDIDALMAEAEFASLPMAPPVIPLETQIERLVSPTTDRMVTTAFSSLANTVLTNNARTLEDLMQDVMRPMIRSWLDDNLPTIVERLVRSEIERVSRGGR